MFAIILSMFTLGLITSVHCVSMCGPMVVTYAVKGADQGSWVRRLLPHGVYQGAKLVSYMLVGVALGAVGAFFNFDAVRPYVMFLAGAFMIILGLGMTGRFPWAQKLTPRPPRALVTALVRMRRKASADAAEDHESLATPLTFGLLTGLMPCAPLMGAQLTAAASGSAIAGGLGMLAFGLGTAPLMVAFGTAANLIPVRFKQRMMVALAIVVMVFGVVFFNRGLMLIGSPVTFSTVKQAALSGPQAQTPAPAGTEAADGVVEVPLTIANVQFVPQQVQIPADRPVRLVIDRQEDNACSDQVAIPQLGILKDVAPFAKTTIDIPATKAGAYTLTCGMGMMSGTLAVGGAAAGAGGGMPAWAWLVLAAGAAGGALYVARKPSRPAAAKGRPASKSGSQHSKSAKRGASSSSTKKSNGAKRAKSRKPRTATS